MKYFYLPPSRCLRLLVFLSYLVPLSQDEYDVDMILILYTSMHVVVQICIYCVLCSRDSEDSYVPDHVERIYSPV